MSKKQSPLEKYRSGRKLVQATVDEAIELIAQPNLRSQLKGLELLDHAARSRHPLAPMIIVGVVNTSVVQSRLTQLATSSDTDVSTKARKFKEVFAEIRQKHIAKANAGLDEARTKTEAAKQNVPNQAGPPLDQIVRDAFIAEVKEGLRSDNVEDRRNAYRMLAASLKQGNPVAAAVVFGESGILNRDARSGDMGLKLAVRNVRSILGAMGGAALKTSPG